MNSETTAVLSFTNFRGGYCSDIPVGEMEDVELQRAENVYWKDGLTKRMGKGSYTSWTGTAIRGGIRANIKGANYTIVAVDTTSSGVELRIGTDTAFASLTYPSSTGVQLTTAAQVQFAYLDNKVVAVNGTDKPMVIYQMASATNVANTIERYDTRTMDDDNIYSGYIEATSTASAVGGYRYTDESADFKSSTTADFRLVTSTITNGWYAACDHTFNYVRLVSAESIPTVSFTFNYFGHNGSMSASETWVSFSPITAPTWTVAENKSIEWNWPTDPTTGESLMTPLPDASWSISGKYAMRALCTTAPSASAAFSACGGLSHTQYLTQILLDDRPDTVAAHKSHIFLGMGNWMRVSPYNQVTGWREAEKEYFSDGGSIQQMLTHGDYLAILLDNAIYAVTGNSWSNWSTRFLTAERGASGKRGAVVVGDELFFMARDGIYKWNGSSLVKVTKHIKTDIEAEDASTCSAINYKGMAWFTFPTGGRVYLFDPDTFRTDDLGDGRVSVYKFPTYTTTYFLNYNGAGDNGYFMGIRNLTTTAPRLDRLEYDDVDYVNGATATIPFTIFTKYYDFGNSHQNKTYRRIKPKVLQATTTAGSVYNLQFWRQDKFGNASYSIATITAGAGSSEYSRELALPPRMDGKTFALMVTHDAQTKAMFLGFALEVEGRKF